MNKNYTVLIVERNAAARERLTRWCWDHGYRATGSGHPRQALCAASRQGFAAAIIDQSLPEMDGLELGGRLKRQVAGLRVLLLSGDPNGVGALEALASGADGFMHLPAQVEQIGSLLASLLGNACPLKTNKTSARTATKSAGRSIGCSDPIRTTEAASATREGCLRSNQVRSAALAEGPPGRVG